MGKLFWRVSLVQSAVVRRVNRVGSRPARSLSPSSRKLPERDTGFDERKTGLSPFLGSKGHVSHCSAQRCCGVGADRHDRAETGRTCRRWSREKSGKRLTGTFLLVIVVQQLARAGGIGDEQTEEGVVPGTWQGHVCVSRCCPVSWPCSRPWVRSLPRSRHVCHRSLPRPRPRLHGYGDRNRTERTLPGTTQRLSKYRTNGSIVS